MRNKLRNINRQKKKSEKLYIREKKMNIEKREITVNRFSAGSEWWRCSRESKGWPERHVGNCSKMRHGVSTVHCFSSVHHSWYTSSSLICACWSLSPSRTPLPFLRRRRDLRFHRLRGRRKPSTLLSNRGTLSRSEKNLWRVRRTEKKRRRTSTGRRELLESRILPPRRSFLRVFSFCFISLLVSSL